MKDLLHDVIELPSIEAGVRRYQGRMYLRSRGGWSTVTVEERDTGVAGPSALLRGAQHYAVLDGEQRAEYEAALCDRAGCHRHARSFPVHSRFD